MNLPRYLCLAVKVDQGERRKRARVVGALSPASPVSFCFSYSIWLNLFTLNVFITNRFSCGTMKTEFYFPPEFYSIFKAYPIPENSYVSQRSFIWSFKIPRIEAQLTNQFPQPEFQSPTYLSFIRSDVGYETLYDSQLSMLFSRSHLVYSMSSVAMLLK